MAKVRITKMVSKWIGMEPDNRIFDMNVKSDRHLLHKLLGGLSNVIVFEITQAKLCTNKELQALISSKDIENLIKYGLLESVEDEKLNVCLSFSIVGDAISCAFERVDTAEKIFIDTRDINVQRFIYYALSEYYRQKQ